MDMVPSWLPICLSLLVVGITAFPMFDDEEFEEIKRALEDNRGNSFFGNGGDYYYDGQYPERNLGFFQGLRPGLEKADIENREEFLEGLFTVTPKWPSKSLKLGQVGGVAVDTKDRVHVFHRASRVWDENSFNKDNTFAHKDEGPIEEATLWIVDSQDGKVLNKSGANRFYMPHGLTIDHEGNRWVTDVAMHQVFKIPPGQEEPTLTLGKPFEKATSNEDKDRFCKPTDVVVTKNGDIFVADGYCNSRVVKFDKDGKYLGQFSQYDDIDFVVPHSLTIVEELDFVCVADRDNGRIACYNAGLNDPKKTGEPERMYEQIYPGKHLGRIFAIEYDETDGLLYATGQDVDTTETPVAYTIDILEHEKYDKWPSDVINEWAPKAAEEHDFDEPHDMAVSPNGKAVYIGLVDVQSKKKLWKFDKAF